MRAPDACAGITALDTPTLEGALHTAESWSASYVSTGLAFFFSHTLRDFALERGREAAREGGSGREWLSE